VGPGRARSDEPPAARSTSSAFGRRSASSTSAVVKDRSASGIPCTHGNSIGPDLRQCSRGLRRVRGIRALHGPDTDPARQGSHPSGAWSTLPGRRWALPRVPRSPSLSGSSR